MEVTTELVSQLFPLFNFMLCTGAWNACFTAQGHTFPQQLLYTQGKKYVADASPSTVMFLQRCFYQFKSLLACASESQSACLGQRVQLQQPQSSKDMNSVSVLVWT